MVLGRLAGVAGLALALGLLWAGGPAPVECRQRSRHRFRSFAAEPSDLLLAGARGRAIGSQPIAKGINLSPHGWSSTARGLLDQNQNPNSNSNSNSNKKTSQRRLRKLSSTSRRLIGKRAAGDGDDTSQSRCICARLMRGSGDLEPVLDTINKDRQGQQQVGKRQFGFGPPGLVGGGAAGFRPAPAGGQFGPLQARTGAAGKLPLAKPVFVAGSFNPTFASGNVVTADTGLGLANKAGDKSALKASPNSNSNSDEVKPNKRKLIKKKPKSTTTTAPVEPDEEAELEEADAEEPEGAGKLALAGARSEPANAPLSLGARSLESTLSALVEQVCLIVYENLFANNKRAQSELDGPLARLKQSRRSGDLDGFIGEVLEFSTKALQNLRFAAMVRRRSLAVASGVELVEPKAQTMARFGDIFSALGGLFSATGLGDALNFGLKRRQQAPTVDILAAANGDATGGGKQPAVLVESLAKLAGDIGAQTGDAARKLGQTAAHARGAGADTKAESVALDVAHTVASHSAAVETAVDQTDQQLKGSLGAQQAVALSKRSAADQELELEEKQELEPGEKQEPGEKPEQQQQVAAARELGGNSVDIENVVDQFVKQKVSVVDDVTETIEKVVEPVKETLEPIKELLHLDKHHDKHHHDLPPTKAPPVHKTTTTSKASYSYGYDSGYGDSYEQPPTLEPELFAYPMLVRGKDKKISDSNFKTALKFLEANALALKKGSSLGASRQTAQMVDRPGAGASLAVKPNDSGDSLDAQQSVERILGAVKQFIETLVPADLSGSSDTTASDSLDLDELPKPADVHSVLADLFSKALAEHAQPVDDKSHAHAEQQYDYEPAPALYSAAKFSKLPAGCVDKLLEYQAMLRTLLKFVDRLGQSNLIDTTLSSPGYDNNNHNNYNNHKGGLARALSLVRALAHESNLAIHFGNLDAVNAFTRLLSYQLVALRNNQALKTVLPVLNKLIDQALAAYGHYRKQCLAPARGGYGYTPDTPRQLEPEPPKSAQNSI